MNFLQEFVRVSRSRRCPICGKPDWCLIKRDSSAAVCARVESGHRWGQAGWFHRLPGAGGCRGDRR